MNREDIIRMAREAGIDGVIQTTSGRSVALDMHKIERLVQAAYAAGAVAEREACAELCERMARRINSLDIRTAALEMAAENIRARGQV